MKTLFQILCLLFCFNCFCQTNSNELQYILNKGQWQNDIKYKASFLQGKVFVCQNSLRILCFDSTNKRYFRHSPNQNQDKDQKDKYSIFSIAPYKSNIYSSQIEGKNKISTFYNYFIGNDKTKHQSRVPAFGNICYSNVYTDIDWYIGSKNSMPKHWYVVKSNANYKQIKTIYQGVDSLYVENQILYIKTNNGTLTEDTLFVYQNINNQLIPIKAKYIVQKEDKDYLVSYEIENYNHNYELIIDPGLVFSTYSGSHSDNWGMTSGYDLSFNLISGGICEGNQYPVTIGAYEQSYKGNWDVVITKYDSLGHNMIFSTYLGGVLSEMPHSITVNQNNEILVFGTTGSRNFPTSNEAFQSQFGGGTRIGYDFDALKFTEGIDIFVTCLSSNGDSLISSTYVGGRGNDGFNFKAYYDNSQAVLYGGNDSLYNNYGDCARGEIITDQNNNVYIASCTFSEDFPITESAYQNVYRGGQEAVVFKLDHSLSTLLFSTFMGGTKDDAAYSIDLDRHGNIYICGGTVSNNYPVKQNGYNYLFNGGSTDAFVSKLSPDGQTLLGSTFFGSTGYDQAFIIRLDKQNHPYIFGQTTAYGTALVYNASYYEPSSGQFIAKFSTNLDTLIRSTVWGTGDSMINISPSGFAVDVCGRIYCAGWGKYFKYIPNRIVPHRHLGTTGLTTTPDAYSTSTDGMDFYILCLDEDMTYLDYATFFGENSEYSNTGNDHVDGGTSRFDKFGAFYLTACASCGGSQGFPTTINSYSTANNSSNCNMASSKFVIHSDYAVADFKCKQVGCLGQNINIINSSRSDNCTWDFGDDSPFSTQSNPIHIYDSPGLYTIKLIAFTSEGCIQRDTMEKKVFVLGNTSQYLDTIECCPLDRVYIGFEGFNYTQEDSISISWTPNNDMYDFNSTNPMIIAGENQLYRLIISNGQCADTFYRYVSVHALKIDSIITFPEGCLNDKQGKAIAIVSDSNEVSYFWSCSNSDSNTAINLSRGTYSLIVTNQNGCSVSKDFTITGSEQYQISDQINNISCWDICDGSITIEAYGGQYPYQYLWANGNQTNTIDSLCPGNYCVKVIDSNNCVVEKCYDVYTFGTNTDFEAWADRTHIYDGEQVELNSTIVEGFDYFWTPSYLVANPYNYQTIAQPTQTTTFIVHIDNNSGCEKSDSLTVEVEYVPCEEPNIFIPNCFTPNNDGKNDILYVSGDYISKFNLMIYDRWGEKVFHSEDLNIGWDGKYRDKFCLAGVYYYRLEIECVGGKKFFKKGDITLIR